MRDLHKMRGMNQLQPTGLFIAALLLLPCAGCGTTAGHAPQIGQVSLTVSGGIAGWSRELTVDQHGMASLTVTNGPAPSTGAHMVPAGTFTRLRSLVADPAFARLAHEYPAPAGAADLQSYALDAEVDGRHLQTVTYDSVQVPAVLSQSLAVMLEILDSFR
jgi:hypothetical protein